MATFKLKCSGDTGELKVHGHKPDIVTFTTAASCAPLQTFKFDQAAPGFTLKGKGKDGISYKYDGTPIPAAGYRFSYQTSEKAMAGNGTGVIKN